MSGKRGKTTATICAAATLLAVLGGGYAARGWIEESWRLSELRSLDEAVRLNAADRLGQLRSFRAVGPLIEAIRANSREIAIPFGSAVGQGSTVGWAELTPLAHALYRTGAGGLRAVERAEQEANAARDRGSKEDWRVSSILATIRNLWRHPEMPVRRLGYTDRPGSGIPY